MNILHIAEGWYNSFLDRAHLLDPEIRELGDTRLSACSNCPVRTENRCDDTKTHINTWGCAIQWLRMLHRQKSSM
jgi:hypothetical protein